jgi:hypothetical protein
VAVRERIIIAAIAVLTGSGAGPSARAAVPDRDRVVVELGVTDSLPSEQVTALRGLLESQLSSRGLSPRLEYGITDVRRWLSHDSKDALLRVALDAPADGGWRLFLVDTTRGRAVARTLTGGLRRDRAAIEAVCDIVVSAALALREGLEVASQSVDEALTGVGPGGAQPAPPAAAAPVTAARDAPAAGAGFALRLQAGAGPALATFARAAPACWGAGAAVSVWHGGAGLEVAAARYLGQTVNAAQGKFTIDRAQIGLSAAAGASWRRARLEGGLGLLLEILERGDAIPAAGSIAATTPDALTRFGPQATATLGFWVSPRVAITWALGAGYFPRRVRYLSAAGPETSLAEPWPLTGSSTLRVNVSIP